MTVDPGAAKAAASRLVRRFIFHAIQGGASEARIMYDGQQITAFYCVDGRWQRQEDMPMSIWPQILRRIRNTAFLTLGPQPPRQEGSFQIVLLEEQRGEKRDYKLGLVITHDESGDDIRVVIPEPTREPYTRPEGYVFDVKEKL